MFHKLFVFLLVASFLISACGNMPPIPISSTPTSAATLTPSATVTPTPAPSSTLTQTLTPSPTPIPTSTATKTPTPVDILAELEKKGVIFSTDTTNKIDLGYGKFSLHFSQGILKRSGLKYIRLHPQVMENFYLQAMGEFMYFNRDYYPEVYGDFFTFQLSVYRYPEDETLLRKLAREILDSGPAPLKFDVGNISGSVNELDMYLVSKDEFINSVLPTLDEMILTYIHNPGWFVPEKDFDIATYLYGNRLVVYAYDLGKPDERIQYRDSPLEILYFDPVNLYWGIFKTWKDAVDLLQLAMAPEKMKYDAHRHYGRDSSMICLGADANAGKLEKCLPYIRYTFTRGLPIPPTPTP